MDDDSAPEQGALFAKSVGEQLREAREAQGLSLADIANRTRVPTRHLEAIEQGRFDAMPSPTYAIGFARSYARVVGLDEQAVANAVRHSPQLPVANATDYETYEQSDPKRLPSRSLATAAAIVALLLVIGVVVYYGTTWLRGTGDVPAPAAARSDPPTIVAAPSATPTAGGQVTLVATDTVWLRVYDAAGKTLVQRELAAGDRYDVPGDADHPMINIGRPDKVQITVNGSVVAPLGDGSHAIKDVPVSASALLARGSAVPTPARAAAPAASAPPPVRRATTRVAPTLDPPAESPTPAP